MYYLTIWHHVNDGDYEREWFRSKDAGKLLAHALSVNPNETVAQETTEWHISNGFPDDIEDESDFHNL